MKKKTYQKGDKLCGMCQHVEVAKRGKKTIMQADKKPALRCAVNKQYTIGTNKCSCDKFELQIVQIPIPWYKRIARYVTAYLVSVVWGLCVQLPIFIFARTLAMPLDDFGRGCASRYIGRWYAPQWCSRLCAGRLLKMRDAPAREVQV